MSILQELDNIRDEFNAIFDEEEVEKGKNMISLEKYEQLRVSSISFVWKIIL